jgi:hypothetical protein
MRLQQRGEDSDRWNKKVEAKLGLETEGVTDKMGFQTDGRDRCNYEDTVETDRTGDKG